MLFKISLNIVLFIYESKVQCSTLIIDRGQWNFD
jgi:hypothetical protein